MEKYSQLWKNLILSLLSTNVFKVFKFYICMTRKDTLTTQKKCYQGVYNGCFRQTNVYLDHKYIIVISAGCAYNVLIKTMDPINQAGS